MKNVLIIFYILFCILTWESNICLVLFYYFIFVFIVYFNIYFYVILLYFIRMKMMKYNITLLLGDIELKKLIAFTDYNYSLSIN